MCVDERNQVVGRYARKSTVAAVMYLVALTHSLSITLTQAMFLLSVPLLLVSGFRKAMVRSLSPLVALMSLLVLWILIGTVFLPEKTRLVKHALSWWHLLLFYVGYIGVQLGADTRKVFLSAVIGGMILAAYGLCQFALLGWARAQGFFHNALTYSNSLTLTLAFMITLPPSLWWLSPIVRSSGWTTFLVFSMIGVILLGLIAGVSRGPLYSFATIASLIVVMRYRWKGGAAVVVVIVVFGMLTYSSPRFERLYQRGWSVSVSDTTRLALWEGTLRLISDYPMFGVGANMFPMLITRYADDAKLDTKGHAHNAYLQVAANYGVPAVVFLCAIYGALGAPYVRAWRHRRTPLALTGLALLAVFLTGGLTENNFGDAEVAMYFWFLQGVVRGEIEISGDRPSPFPAGSS